MQILFLLDLGHSNLSIHLVCDNSWCLSDDDSLFLSFLLDLSIGVCCEKEQLPRAPRFICMMIYYIRMDTWIFILFSGLKSNDTNFVVQIVLALAIRISFRLPLFSLRCCHLTSLFSFCHCSSFQDHLVFTLPLL